MIRRFVIATIAVVAASTAAHAQEEQEQPAAAPEPEDTDADPWFADDAEEVVNAPAEKPAPSDQEIPEFNREVLKVIYDADVFPWDQGYGRMSGANEWKHGATRPFSYDGKDLLIPAIGAMQGKTNCSGVTFQAFLMAYERYARDHHACRLLGGLTGDEAVDLRTTWFNNRKEKGKKNTGGALDALVTYAPSGKQLGENKSLDDALPGDFINWWKPNSATAGHTAVFLGWVSEESPAKHRKDCATPKSCFWYWSSQPISSGFKKLYGMKNGGIAIGTKAKHDLDLTRTKVVRVVPRCDVASPPSGE